MFNYNCDNFYSLNKLGALMFYAIQEALKSTRNSKDGRYRLSISGKKGTKLGLAMVSVVMLSLLLIGSMISYNSFATPSPDTDSGDSGDSGDTDTGDSG